MRRSGLVRRSSGYSARRASRSTARRGGGARSLVNIYSIPIFIIHTLILASRANLRNLSNT